MNQGMTKTMRARTWTTGKTCARSVARYAVDAACEPYAIAVEATARSETAQNRTRGSHDDDRHRRDALRGFFGNTNS